MLFVLVIFGNSLQGYVTEFPGGYSPKMYFNQDLESSLNHHKKSHQPHQAGISFFGPTTWWPTSCNNGELQLLSICCTVVTTQKKKMCFDYCYPKVAWFQRTLFSLCVLPIIPPKVFCEFWWLLTYIYFFFRFFRDLFPTYYYSDSFPILWYFSYQTIVFHQVFFIFCSQRGMHAPGYSKVSRCSLGIACNYGALDPARGTRDGRGCLHRVSTVLRHLP